METDTLETDRSLSKSTSLSFSASSIDRSHSNFENSDEDESEGSGHRRTRRKRVKNKRVELIPPEEKLKKCEARYDEYVKQGESEFAMQEVLKLPPLVRLVYGDKHWKYAEACWKVAKGYLDLKGMGKQSVKHGEAAKSVILSGCQVDDFEKSSFVRCVCEVYLCLGRGLTVTGERYKEAENALLKAWQVLASSKKLKGGIHLPTASEDDTSERLKKEIKLALAEVYILTKQSDKAQKCLNFVIKLTTEKTSDSDASLVSVHGQLAKAEKARKKSEINYEAVVEHRLRAHEIASASHSLHSTEVADTAFALGLAYANIDSETTQGTAETYFNEALRAYENHCGSDDPNTLKVRDALCKVWTRTERQKEAVEELKQTIRIKREVFGACSAQVADTYKLIGGIYLSQEDVVNGHKNLEKCLEIEEILYGKAHWKTKSTRTTLEAIGQLPSMSATKPSETKMKERPKFSSTIRPKT